VQQAREHIALADDLQVARCGGRGTPTPRAAVVARGEGAVFLLQARDAQHRFYQRPALL